MSTMKLIQTEEPDK